MVLANRLGYFLCGLFLGLTLSGCASTTGPEEYPPFDSSVRTVVPASEWVPVWEGIVECAAPLQRPMPPLNVYSVPSRDGTPYQGFNCGRAFLCWGLYHQKAVYVVEGLDPINTGTVAAHEMLHHILGGDGDHCSPLWDKCGVAQVTTCGSVSRGDHDPPEEDV
jgi:hypothetical protein